MMFGSRALYPVHHARYAACLSLLWAAMLLWAPTLLWAPMTLAQSSDPYPCDEVEVHRHFDFWIGAWEVTDEAGDKRYGVNHIRQHADGCALLEEYHTEGGFNGLSLNYYHPGDGLWHQRWIDNGSSIIETSGTLTGDAMILEGRIHYFGTGVEAAFRGAWTPLEDGRVRQFLEQQNEEGVWETWFDGYYRRLPAAAP